MSSEACLATPPSTASSSAAAAGFVDRAADPERRDRDAFRAWFYGLTFAYPLLWLVGFAGLYWLLLAAGAVFCLRRAKLSGLVWGVLAVPGVLVLSAPIGLLGTSAGGNRLVGLAANVAVWLSLAAVVHLAETGDEARPLSRAFVVLGLAQGAITVVGTLASPTLLPVPLLHGLASSMPGGIGAFMSNETLYSASWLGQEEFRSAGIMGQPTWAGAIALLSLLAAAYLLLGAREKGLWRWVAVAAIPAAVFSVELSLSRAVEVGLVAALGVGAAVAIRRVSGLAFLAVLAIIVAAVTFVLATSWPTLLEWVTTVNAQREGSLYARNEIYAETWRLVTKHPFPALGYGVKPEESELVAPVATHSSYLGMLFRGGVLGVLLLVGLYLAVLRRGIAAGSIWATTAIVFVALWSIFEDMDPGHLVPLGLALAVAWAQTPHPTKET